MFVVRPFRSLICARISPQFFVNGIRVDTDALSGAWTTWNARVLYYTYDITSLLAEGSNVIGVMLGHGWRDTSAFPPLWMAGPCDKNEMILRMAVVDTTSGSLVVGSDPLWNGMFVWMSPEVVSTMVLIFVRLQARRSRPWSRIPCTTVNGTTPDWNSLDGQRPALYRPRMAVGRP
jgi:hypothetical protein